MTVRVEPSRHRLPRPAWALGIVAAWAGGVLAAELLSRAAGLGVCLCLFKRLTGLPCATCGLTRGVLAVFRGDLLAGWLHNPLWMTVLAVAAAMVGLRLIAGRKVTVRLTRTERRLAWVIAPAAVAVNWAYVICYVG